MSRHCTALVLCSLVTLAASSPKVVPKEACVDMKAKGSAHNYAIPQETKAPYEYHFPKKILNTQSLEFTIQQKHDGPMFAAFMIQARKENSNVPVGTFWPKTDNSRSVECSAAFDTGSHNNPYPKSIVTMVWTPPTDFHGKVTFYVTVAETKYVFWAHEKAGDVTVKKPDD